jgi:hypothetical protein
MWNLKGHTKEEKVQNIQVLRQSFEGLRGRISGLICLEIGVDQSHVDYACDVVLYSEFESETALENYAVHPEHLRVKDEIAGLRIAKYQVDYQVGK